MNEEYYDEEYFAERSFLPKHLLLTIAEVLRESRSQDILEVGCGTGKLIHYLKI